MLNHLRRAYGDQFPAHISILDSGPGQFTPSRATAAVVAGMPPLVKALAYPTVMLFTIL